MSNNDFNDADAGPRGRAVSPPSPGVKAGPAPAGKIKSTGYGGLPGKAQPKARNNGIVRGPFYVASKGI